MKNKKIILIITFLSLISLLPILTEINIWTHDIPVHITIIENLKVSITDFFIPSRILPNIANNFGYATHIFYPMLPHLLTAIVYKITSINLTTIITIVYLIITIISSYLVYHLSFKISKNKYVSLASSAIFIFMPYRLGDIVVRGAFNEVFTFIFIPMIILSLFELVDANHKKFFYLFILGTLGMIYTHLIITMYLAIFLIPFLFIFKKELLKKENISIIIKSVMIITLCSLPMIVPILEHNILGNYMVFQKDYMSNISYLENFNNRLIDYLLIKSDYSWDIPLFINIFVIITFIVTVSLKFKKKDFSKKEAFLLIFTFLSFIMTLNIFPWHVMPDFMLMIQFAWRNQTMLIIGISVLAPQFLLYINKSKVELWSYCYIAIILFTSINLLVLLSNHKYILPNNINIENGMGYSKEYLPVNTYNNINYFNTRDELIKTDKDVTISIKENKVPYLSFNINNLKEETQVELPRLFYLGYSLKKDNIEIPLKENEYGFIEASIKENGTYYLTYETTALTKISTLLSLIGITLFIKEIINKKNKINTHFK